MQLASKKRDRDGKVVQSSEKTTVKVVGKFQYPPLNKVLVLPDSKQKIEPIKKVKRRNDFFYLMLGKFNNPMLESFHPLNLWFYSFD